MRVRWMVLVLLAGVVASVWAEPPVLFRSGFEETDDDGTLVGWSLGKNGIAEVTTEAAREGESCLKIVDPSETDGATVFSSPVRVVSDRNCFAMVWTKCVDGNGLGLYLKFYDAEGKGITVDEKVYHRQVSFCGEEWTPVFLVVPAVEGAATCKIWLHSYSKSKVTCYVDDALLCWSSWRDLARINKWRGAYPDNERKKESKCALRWEHRLWPTMSRKFDPPQDWSDRKGMKFWMHSNSPLGSTFVLNVLSENDETEGGDYYSRKIPIDWIGWKEFDIPFAQFVTCRKPLGWHHVEAIVFNAKGWEQEFKPDTVLVLDGIKLVPKDE